MEFDHPEGRIVLVTMPEFSAWVAAAAAIERSSIGDSFYLALFTGQRQTDRLIMRNESDVEGRHAFRQVRGERLTAELTRIVEGLFAPFPLDEGNKAQRARAVDQRARVLAEWLDAQAMRDSKSDDTAWFLKPRPSLMFINGAGELDQKHDQNLRDTCVMLLDRAGCDLLTIGDITGHSYRSAQTIVKHYRARNAIAPMLASTGLSCRYAKKG